MAKSESSGDVTVFNLMIDGLFNQSAKQMQDTGKQYAPSGNLHQEIELRKAVFLQKYKDATDAEKYKGVRLFEIWARYIRRRIRFVIAEGQAEVDPEILVLAVGKLQAALGAEGKKELGVGYISSTVINLTAIRIFLNLIKEPNPEENLWQLYKRFDPEGTRKMNLNDFYVALPAKWKNAYLKIGATYDDCAAAEKWLEDKSPKPAETFLQLYKRFNPYRKYGINSDHFYMLLPALWKAAYPKINIRCTNAEEKNLQNLNSSTARELLRQQKALEAISADLDVFEEDLRIRKQDLLASSMALEMQDQETDEQAAAVEINSMKTERPQGKMVQGEAIQIPLNADPLALLLSLLQEPLINSAAIIQIYELYQSEISALLRLEAPALLESYVYVIQLAQRKKHDADPMEDRHIAALVEGFLTMARSTSGNNSTRTRLSQIQSEVPTSGQAVLGSEKKDSIATENESEVGAPARTVAKAVRYAALFKERNSLLDQLAALRREADALRSLQSTTEELLADQKIVVNRQNEELATLKSRIKQLEDILIIKTLEIERKTEREIAPKQQMQELAEKKDVRDIPDFPGLDKLLKALSGLSIPPSNPETKAEYARAVAEALVLLDKMAREVERRASRTEPKNTLVLTPAERGASASGSPTKSKKLKVPSEEEAHEARISALQKRYSREKNKE